MKTKSVISALTAAVMALSMTSFTSFAADAPTGNSALDPIPYTFGEIMSGELIDKSENWYVFELDKISKLDMMLVGKFGNSGNYCKITKKNDINNAFVSIALPTSGTKESSFYLEAGTYYIECYKEYSFIDGNYQFKMTAEPIEVTEFSGTNNNIEDAFEIKLDTDYKATFTAADKTDYYTFEMDEDGPLTFDFKTGMSKLDLTLYDNAGKEISAETLSKGEKDDKLISKNYKNLMKGKYSLRVSWNSNTSTYGKYDFALRKGYDKSVSGIMPYGDVNGDGSVDSSDASLILAFYAYTSTGGTEKDMSKWMKNKK